MQKLKSKGKRMISLITSVIIAAVTVAPVMPVSGADAAPAANHADQQIVRSGDTWRYLDNNEDPWHQTALYKVTVGTPYESAVKSYRYIWSMPHGPHEVVLAGNTMDVGFDDDAWKNAPGPFGYKEPSSRSLEFMEESALEALDDPVTQDEAQDESENVAGEISDGEMIDVVKSEAEPITEDGDVSSGVPASENDSGAEDAIADQNADPAAMTAETGEEPSLTSGSALDMQPTAPAETEPAKEPETEIEAEPKVDAEIETEPKAETKIETEPKAKAETEAAAIVPLATPAQWGTVNTELEGNIPGSSTKRVPAYFFRYNFSLSEDPSWAKSINYKLRFDDAVVIYLNGTEIGRHNTPAKGYSDNMEYGASRAPKDPLSVEKKIILKKDLLKQGENVLAVELHQASVNSSDAFFDFEDFTLSAKEILLEPEISAVTMQPGANESELNFAWLSSVAEDGKLSIWKDGETPAAFTATSAALSERDGFLTNKVTVTGIKPGTTYKYTVSNGDPNAGGAVSAIRTFTTGNSADDYSFLFVGDPQIGASGSVASDAKGWNDTITRATAAWKDVNFIVSAGDQVETVSIEDHYDGFLSPEGLGGLPLAPTVGNHDNGANYLGHYNMPNHDGALGETAAGGDYSYTYGETLFLHINSNDTSIAEHKAFIEKAIAGYKTGSGGETPAWKILVFHFGPYTGASHTTNAQMKKIRAEWSPVISQLDIDAVLNGHDHVYTRSYMLGGQTVESVADGGGSAPITSGYTAIGENATAEYTKVKPGEAVYITANSASGSKYYELTQTAYPFWTKNIQTHTPTITKVDVSEDSLRFNTYYTNADIDKNAPIDSFTLYRGDKDPTINILHTNDLHGSVAGALPATVSQLAKIAEIKDGSENALLVDGGDATQGNSFATLTQGADVIELMNMAGYDVMTAGNHEFDYGLDKLIENAQNADFPILSANTLKSGTPVLKGATFDSGEGKNNGTWYIEKVKGVDVGFFGITTPETATKTNPNGIAGVTFGGSVQEIVDVSNNQMKELEKAGADITVGIMHLGVDPSSDITSGAIANAFGNGNKPDIIIDGHSHTDYREKVNGIQIAQTGGGGNSLGKVTIDYDAVNEKIVKIEATRSAITAQMPFDEAVEKRAKELLTAQKSLLAPVVAKSAQTLWGGTVNGLSEARLYETNLGSLVADSMRDAALKAVKGSAEYGGLPVVALQNGGGVRAVIKAGDVTKGDVISVLPFGNSLAYKIVTPKILFEALENGVGSIEAQDPATGKLTGAGGRFPQISGMRFEFDPSKTATTYDGKNNPTAYGNRVTKLVLQNDDGTDGQELLRTDDKTRIILASNDFEIAGGDGYIMLKGLESVGEGGALDEIFSAYMAAMTPNGGAFSYPNTKGRIATLGVYTPKNYSPVVTLKKDASALWASASVSYKVDGVPKSGRTDAQGKLIIGDLTDGPHIISFGGAGDVLVNNYSGAGLENGTAVTVVSSSIASGGNGGGSSGGSSGGGGGGGGSSSASSASSTVSASTNDSSVSVSGKQSGATVTLDMPDTKINELASSAKEKEVTIDLSKSTGVTEATMPSNALTQLAGKGLDVTIGLPQGSVTLDAQAAASVADQVNGTNLTVSLKKVNVSDLPAAQKSAVKESDVVVDINVNSGSQHITSFGGGKVTVNVPYNGPIPAAVWYLNDSGQMEKLESTYDQNTKTVTFVTNHLSKYVIGQDSANNNNSSAPDSPTSAANPFADVDSSAWYYEHIMKVYTNHLMNGTSASPMQFSPDARLTRGMAVTVLYNLAGSPDIAGAKSSFTDVAKGAWYHDAVIWAADNGIVSGVGNGRFAPNADITREQAAVIFYQCMEKPDTTGDVDFADKANISSWANQGVAFCQANGVITGKTGNRFDAKGYTTRAEYAAMINGFASAMTDQGAIGDPQNQQ